jgi:hypothetical protein
MSLLGQKLPWRPVLTMSGLTLKADERRTRLSVQC